MAITVTEASKEMFKHLTIKAFHNTTDDINGDIKREQIITMVEEYGETDLVNDLKLCL
jgi:hypothetical protein